MVVLVPHGYGGFPSFQFSAPNQAKYQYYNGGYSRPGISFAPHYPTQPLYQPPMKPVDRYAPAPYINQVREPGLGTQMVLLFNRLDEQYRQEQYLRQMQKMEKKYWKQQAYNMPPPMYGSEQVIQYEKETRYIPFPVYINSSGGVYAGAGSNLPVASGVNMSLPPKVRVIFIPPGQSFAQQPYTGSLVSSLLIYSSCR